MIYRFEKQLAQSWFVEIEADSFDEACDQLNNDNPIWDADYGGESELVSSRCLQFKDEDAAADFEYDEEIEWEP